MSDWTCVGKARLVEVALRGLFARRVHKNSTLRGHIQLVCSVHIFGGPSTTDVVFCQSC